MFSGQIEEENAKEEHEELQKLVRARELRAERVHGSGFHLPRGEAEPAADDHGASPAEAGRGRRREKTQQCGMRKEAASLRGMANQQSRFSTVQSTNAEQISSGS